jgi:hypothetical protein
MNIARWYFKHHRAAELSFSAAVAAVFFAFRDNARVLVWPEAGQRTDIMLSIMGLSASLLGFVLAASTFLISHVQHPRLELLRDSGGFQQLMRAIGSSLWRLLLLTLCSGMMAVATDGAFKALVPAITFLITLNVLSLSTLIWATMAILKIPVGPAERRGQRRSR